MIKISTVTSSEAGLFSNTHLVETDDSVVVVDPPMLVRDSEAARGALDAIGKPLAGIVYTHPHPDHVNGGTLLRGSSGAPVYATPDTDRVSREIDGPKREFWTGIHGDDYPRETTYATDLVVPGDEVAVGGLWFTVHDIGAGECATGAIWRIRDAPVAFVGDLAYNHVHPWLFEGRSRAWLAQLDRARTPLDGVGTLHVGHGPDADLDLLTAQAGYIRAYQDAVREISGGAPALDDAGKAELERRMTTYLPGALLPALIAMSADAVAAELAATG